MPSFRRSLLAASLALALGDVGASTTRSLWVEVPTEWPLAYERKEGTTPLRSRIEAMRRPRDATGSWRVPRTRIVANCADDDSAGSLRMRIAEALSGDTIDLSALTCSRISLSQGALKIELDDLTLRGPGADRLALDGNDHDRILFHPGSGTLTVEDLTLANGRFEAVDNDIGFGGCVATAASLTLRNAVIRDCTAVGVGSYGGAVLSGFLTMVNSTISGSTAFGDHPTNGTAAYGGGAFSYGVDILDSTISGNTAIGTDNAPLTHWEIGGGLFIARNGGTIEGSTFSDNFAIRFAGGLTQEGDLVLRNSTISGNRTEQDDGGGIRVRQDTSILVENSTIAGNHAGTSGGGVSFIGNALPSVMQSTLLAGNTANSGGADLDSVMPLTISGSHNLILSSGANLSVPADTLEMDPELRPLANNGGPTRTHALLAGSIAIDRGANPADLPTDQRGPGFLRVVDGNADIGAFEVQGAIVAPAALSGPGRAAGALLALLLVVLACWRGVGRLGARNSSRGR